MYYCIYNYINNNTVTFEVIFYLNNIELNDKFSKGISIIFLLIYFSFMGEFGNNIYNRCFLQNKKTTKVQNVSNVIPTDNTEKLTIEDEKLTNLELNLLEETIKNFENGREKIFISHEVINDVFYNFYISPQIWYSLEYKEKQNLLADCVAYCSIKLTLKNKDYLKNKSNANYLLCYIGTKIMASTNRQELAGIKNGEMIYKDNGNLNATYKVSDYIPVVEEYLQVADLFAELKNLENSFKNNADTVPSEKNDKNFREFLSKYWDIIEIINEHTFDGIKQLTFEDANGTDNPKMWSVKAKNQLKYYQENGIDVEFGSEGFYAVVKTDYLKSFYRYLTPEYIKWLDFDKKIQTEIGIQDNCYSKLYEIVKEGKDYYNK